MLLYHTGHGSRERARGASQINAALDHEFRVDSWEDNKTLVTFTKQKEDTNPVPMGFIKVPIELTINEETLATIGSIALERCHDLPKQGDRMSKAAKAVFEMLPETGSRARAEIRDEYCEKYATGNRVNDRKRFDTTLRALLESGKVDQIEGQIARTQS